MSDDQTNPCQLPPGLPAPHDDGACAHLPGMALPDIALPSATGETWRLTDIARDRAVTYVYPATGVPGKDPIPGWDNIPGAPGCTVQSLGFAELHPAFLQLGYPVFGISAQDRAAQIEFQHRTEVPQILLSDAHFQLRDRLLLPTFQAQGQTFYKRLALVLQAGTVRQVFYPVFPPDRCAATVLAWLRANG